MRLLVDERLSKRVAHVLVAAGHDAVHVSALGLLGEPDVRIMSAAAEDGRVLVSTDTDFGELLALGRRGKPSSKSRSRPGRRRRSKSRPRAVPDRRCRRSRYAGCSIAWRTSAYVSRFHTLSAAKGIRAAVSSSAASKTRSRVRPSASVC